MADVSGTVANAPAAELDWGGSTSSWCSTKKFWAGGIKSAASGTKPRLKSAVSQKSLSSSDVHFVANARSNPCAWRHTWVRRG